MIYYTAEFLNYHPFLKQKLELFLSHHEASFCLGDYCMTVTQKTWDYLSPASTMPWPQNWFVHGSCLTEFTLINTPLLSIPCADGATLLECNIILRWFSVNYDWAIIPWGGCTSRFNSFVFISANEFIRNSFVNICSNVVNNIEGSYAKMTDANLLINQYNIESEFSHHACCVLIKEVMQEVGNLLWQSCNLNSCNLPWVISYPMDDDDDDTPFGLVENEDFRYIATLEFTPEQADDLYSYERLGVYEPQCQDVLLTMLQLHWQDPDTLLVVANSTDLNLLTKLLKKTGHYGASTSYSDLSSLQEILEMGEWFYELNADRNDYKYSMFASKNNQLISNIDSYCTSNNGYSSVTYF
jgi:hypothetical protein